jgi:hypothetical protein
MEKKFKESTIPEDFSRALSQQAMLCGPANTYKVATTVFHGVSSCLGAIKNKTVPKAIVFRAIDGSFIAGAKVEFIPNDENDKSNPSDGRWDYTWSFYEDDMKGADVIEVATNSLIITYFTTSGANLFNMKFAGADICITMCTLTMEMIKKWLTDNVTPNDPSATLTLEGVFTATGNIVDGKIELGLSPSGEMKVLVKGDDKIQE